MFFPLFQSKHKEAEAHSRRALAIIEQTRGSDPLTASVNIDTLPGILQAQVRFRRLVALTACAFHYPIVSKRLPLLTNHKGNIKLQGDSNVGWAARFGSLRLKKLAMVIRILVTKCFLPYISWIIRRSLVIVEQNQGSDQPVVAVVCINLANVLWLQVYMDMFWVRL